MRRFSLILAVLVISLSNIGCAGLFESTCTKALPMIVQGNAVIDEAQEALLQAENAIRTLRNESVQSEALKAISDARVELRRAEGLLQAASAACTAPNLHAIFESFADAWKLVRPFLGNAGGAGAAPVDDPVAYKLGSGE